MISYWKRWPGARIFIQAGLWALFACWIAPAAEPDTRIQASADSGLLQHPIEVTLSASFPGAQIYWSTNGENPNPANGHRYTEPLLIERTSVLRAVAILPGEPPSEPLVRTYLFPEDVLNQRGSGFPSFWGYTNGQPVQADYEMDPEMVKDPAQRSQLVAALRRLPSVSLSTETQHLFDPRTGIYANPMETGRAWERPVTMDWLPADGSPGFQVRCGIRIHGGWNRRPEECPKHSFRLAFRKDYGPKTLEHELFEQAGPREFDSLVLRGGCNNTWLHWSGEERQRGDYLRDQWMRDTARAMGLAAPRGRFVHLYLNGLYWGLYNLVERPDAFFIAAREGGRPKDYDSRNADEIIEGDPQAWNHLFALVNAGVTNAAVYAEIAGLIDLPRFADYMLLNFYGANADWDGASNWYAARRRRPPGTFQFFVWDAERTLEFPEDDRIDTDSDFSPLRLFQRLRHWPEFRRLLTQQARRHCSDGGALTPEAAGARYAALAAQIQEAILAESVRWGDYRRDVHQYRTGPYELYTPETHWRSEVQRLITSYFPQRTSIFLDQLKRRGLWEHP